MQAGLLAVAAAFLTSILSGIFGMAGGLVLMVGGTILDRISDAHFRASRRWIVTIIGATFLFQAAQIVLA
ncbi:hypothetical protein [Sphingopyxis sp. 22461]|uniref:hypothetical protein n=1 Tax=Sphingopyxis sp. 22461 TaxID=3453923 RepID=UPI003F8445A0